MSVFPAIVGLLFAAACVYTVVAYPNKYGALTGRSRLYRTVVAFLLDLLLGLVLLGALVDWTPPADPALRVSLAFRFIAYTLACVFLALSLLCLAALDWLEIQVVIRRSRRDVLVKMAEEEARRRAAGLTPQGPPADEPKSADTTKTPPRE